MFGAEAGSNIFVDQDAAAQRGTPTAKSLKTGRKSRAGARRLGTGTWSLFCSCVGMETHSWTGRLIALAILLLSGARAWAQVNGFERLRTESPYLRAVIADATRRSPTFRSLVDRIEQSDVIVYVNCHHFATLSLEGRTYLVPNPSHARYVFVEITCPAPYLSSIAIVAHELRHAVEIASAASAVDIPSLDRLFSQIGFLTCEPDRTRRQYETREAIDTAARVRSEFLRAEAQTGMTVHPTNTSY
jgi:hypothetical protein